MKTMMLILPLMVFILGGEVAHSQNKKAPRYLADYKKEYAANLREANLEWFKHAGFGLFIHYGLYSQLGKGEWVQLRDTIPLGKYEKLKQTFDPSGFDAEAICDLAIKAGMKYITITSKHHDGFCLFKTSQTPYNSWDAVHRDLIGELAEACELRKPMHWYGNYLPMSLFPSNREPMGMKIIWPPSGMPMPG